VPIAGARLPYQHGSSAGHIVCWLARSKVTQEMRHFLPAVTILMQHLKNYARCLTLGLSPVENISNNYLLVVMTQQ
jgi:hypothetical protein